MPSTPCNSSARLGTAGLGLAALMGMAIGCANPAVKQRLARREQNLQRTAQVFAELEADRDKQLQRTAQLARDQHQRDIQNTARNATEIERRCRAEFERWEKEQPGYRQAIGRELEGNVNNLEPTLIDILY